MILVGTEHGVSELDGGPLLTGHRVVWLDARSVLTDGGDVVEIAPGGRTLTHVDDATCFARTQRGLLVGTARAHLVRDGGVVESFDGVPGRDDWYTPWGGPPDTRSIAEATDGTLHVNVHVGGIPRSRDGGETWQPTIDVDADVHQVLAHPTDPKLILAAGAIGLCVSRDGGDSYDVLTDGLHSTYARAVAIAGDVVLVTASAGPRGGRAAVYRTIIAMDRPFERCTDGVPDWFDDNIDTGCLSALDDTAVFGTVDGEVYVSGDAGSTWERAASGLPPVRAVAIG
jgi:hypothetical protein